MTTPRDKATDQRGFTLMEMLIVIAIIAVLVSVAIPVLGGVTSRAKESTDLANMRAAYAAATAEWMSSQDPAQRYYYSGGSLTTRSTGIVGYGQSEVDASTFSSNLPVPVAGVPNKNGEPQFITIVMGDNGVEKLYWGASGYSGPIVKTPNDYLTLSNEERLQSDIELLDAMQEQARSMTYGQLLDIMAAHKLKKYSWRGTNNVCYWLATSAINLKTGEIRTDKNEIFTPELFEAAGFDTNPENLYILGSVPNTPKNPDDYKCYVYIDLGATYDYAQSHRDELASNALMYENDDGRNPHIMNHDARAAM